MPAHPLFGAVLLCLLLVASTAQASLAAPRLDPRLQTLPVCEPGPGMAILGALDTLRTWLGASIGDPVDCTETDGDELIQHTTTGAAFYDPRANEATFTDGFQRWSTGPQGRRFWRSPEAVPQPVDLPPLMRSVRCPVLYTHEVGSQASLRALLVALMSAGYRPTSLLAVDRAMAGVADPPAGCLVLTFDDALYSQYLNALPVLQALDVPAVFFVMPAYTDGVHRYMAPTEIQTLQRRGHEVGAHTCNHASLPRLRIARPDAFLAEILDCKRTLENLLGVNVAYFAYPNGSSDSAVAAAVAASGYRMAFSTQTAALLTATNAFGLPRIRFDVGESPAAVIQRIRGVGG